jgi:glycosyltransferase involved in cell wall biosynthesis
MTKLGYLLKKFPRLSETFVLGEVLAQEDHGTEVHVFSRRSPDDEPRHPELERLRATVEVLPSTRIIDPWRELFSASEGSQELLENVRGTLESLRNFGLQRLPSLMAEALYLRRRCAELDIGHLHVHFATEAAITALLLQGLGGPTYSVTAHAKDIYRSTVDLRVLEKIVGESEFVVTVCDANIRFLTERLGRIAETKVRRLYNGIDVAGFAETPGEVVPGRILSVGRMVEKKGFDVLVDALARLHSRAVAFTAVLAGDGDERETIENDVRRRGLERLVELPGPLDQGRVRELLATSEVFCLPCVIGKDGNRDALPTVLLEAQAAGVPIVSTPVTGIPEILDGGAAGALVPCHDPAATAAALESLLGDSARRESLAAAGRLRAAEVFDRRKNSMTLKAWFDECLRKSESACASAT